MDQPDPVASALSLPEVLEAILDHLNVRSLLSCRQANKFWNKAASPVIKKRPAWIKVDSVFHEFDALYKCVSKSQDFPFRGLHITWRHRSVGRGNVNLQLQKYLKKFGKLHTHVRLEEMFSKQAGQLLGNLSEMSFLEIRSCSFRSGEQLGAFCMPSLRALSLKRFSHGIQSVLKEILLAAPSLEKIEHVDCMLEEVLEAIWDTDRVELVSSMTLQDNISVGVCNRLVSRSPKLTSLSISGMNWSSSTHEAAIKSVLFASQNTLKTLSLNFFYVQLDEMPVFSQLQELNVTTVHRNWSTILPTLSSALFPKLRRIRLDLGHAAINQGLVENHELPDFVTPMETVNLLELDGLLFPNDAEYLAKVLPRVSHIRLQYPQACCGNSEFQTATSIWSLRAFRSLRKLDIRKFPFNSSKFIQEGSSTVLKVNTITSMDEFLTGIPSQDIRAKLGSLPKMEIDSAYNEILRPNGSLVQLTGLEELTVFVTPVDGFTVEDLSSYDPFITMISVRYALELLPGLRLTFLCCPSLTTVLKKALEPVQDYVSLVEWTDDPEEF